MAQNPQPSQSDSQPGKNTVLVIGAGPVGLFLSILLARANIPVIVLEAKDVLDDTPKSLAHSPVLYPDFVRAGIFEEFEEAAKDLQQITVNFRRTSDLELITTIHSVLGRPAPLIYPQNKFNRLLYRHISKYDCAQVHMGHQVLDIDNTASDRVTATVLTSSGVTKTFTASYLIGADGGRGRVRGACGIPFEGDTLRRHLIASDVRYPFEKYGWARNPNFMIDPDIAGMIGPIDAHGLWRVVFTLPGDEASITPERIKAAIPGAFEAMFHGPRPLKYTIERLAPYKAQQLCAKTFRQGRVLLIGDAAHLTNPFAVLGLASGILDAASLALVFESHFLRGAPESLFDAWATARRDAFRKVVDPISRAAFWSTMDPEHVVENHPMLAAARAGPNAQPPPLVTDVTMLEGWVGA